LLSAEQEFNNAIRQDLSARGPIRIGCFEPFGSIMLIEVLRKMRARLGAFECTLLETDQVSLKRALDRGEVDIAVIYDLGPDFSGAIEHIGQAPPHAMVHSSNPLAKRDDISIDDLAQEPLVLLNLPLTTTYLMTLFDYASRRPRVSFQSGHYETIIRAVSAGFGSTILNAWPIRPLPAETDTYRLRIRESLPAPNIVTVDHYGDQKPPMVLELIAELKSHMALSYHGSFAPEG
jgi:DNA-binding transcriptional LysR family regulator